MSNADAEKLRRLLLAAEKHVREHAVEQSYRRDAMRAIRERYLERYHQSQWESAAMVADALVGVAAVLVPGEEVDWKPAGAIPIVAPPDRATTQLIGMLDEPSSEALGR
jgi:hypothetical protein